jgi:hypothetical protein
VSSPRIRWTFVAGALLVVSLVAGGVWLAVSPERPPATRSTPSEPTAAPAYPFEVRLGRVRAVPVDGSVRRRLLAAPAQAVRQTMTGLYSAAFVDPGLWAGGRFPSVFGFFGGQARQRVHRDLEDLTLGPAAAHLAAVRPGRASLGVRFLMDAHRHPVAAVAAMRFVGAAITADGGEIPLRHGGEYVLRRTGGRWLVVAYEVQGRLGGGAGA